MAPEYVVVLRGPSTARIKAGGPPLKVRGATPLGPAHFTFDTHYQDRGFEALLPAAMWLEVRGETRDDVGLPEVIENYANVAIGFLPLIATATNTDVDDPEVHLALDMTPDRKEHEYFQNFVPDRFTTRLRQARCIDVAATLALGAAIQRHERKDRLRRALAHYRETLRYWHPGKETFAVSHLWMAVEALTKVALELALSQGRHETMDDLCHVWGVDKKCLDAETRTRLIFHGDEDLMKNARDASDGWEHSFMPLDEVRSLATSVRDDAARHIRAAILELSEMDADRRSILLSPPYDTPLPTIPLTKYVWGTFLGPGGRLAPEGKEYPNLTWASTMTALEANRDGTYGASFDEKLTVECGQGVQFRAERYEVWGAPPDQPSGDGRSAQPEGPGPRP